MKLWDKGYKLSEKVESFMTGDDPVLDKILLPYDCQGSIAHAQMLAKIGILTQEEYALLESKLNEVIRLSQEGKFEIQASDEDVHTAWFTERLFDYDNINLRNE